MVEFILPVSNVRNTSVFLLKLNYGNIPVLVKVYLVCKYRGTNEPCVSVCRVSMQIFAVSQLLYQSNLVCHSSTVV